MNEGWAESVSGRELERARLSVDPPASYASREEVLSAVREFGGSGWICYSDRVVEVRGGDAPDGAVLSGELCRGTVSLHVRFLGGKWVAHRIERFDGEEHLLFRKDYARLAPPGQGGEGGTVSYEIAWKRDDKGVWRPWASRFAGIGGAE